MNIRDERLTVDLADGRRVSVPLEFYPTLRAASPRQRRNWRYWPYLTAIEWPALDLQLGVEGIVAGRREHIPPPGFRERTIAAMAKAGLKMPPLE